MFSRWRVALALTFAVFLCITSAEGRTSEVSEASLVAAQDDQLAKFTRLREAAETGDPQALFNFGAYFYQEQNYARAREWWGRAARSGMVRAQLQLAMLYRDGDGGPEDSVEAAYWFRKAAEQGNPDAQNEMGVLYWRGEGVDKDRVKAGTWFGRAAASKNVNAEINLGWFYQDTSDGVLGTSSYEEAVLLTHYAPSPVKAFKWFCKAATQGNARAQFKVGEAYSNGYGAGMNKLQARLWLEKAAQQQDEDAITWLKGMCEMAWYTRLENWVYAALAGELSGVADCSGLADRRHAGRGEENTRAELEITDDSAENMLQASEPADE